MTSMLTVKVYDESIINTMRDEALGKVSIPLLTIANDEKTWYELDSRAKSNGPRIQLQMSIAWNPIKASFRLLSPKTNKYSVPLIYGNLKFIKDVFTGVYYGNEYYKRFTVPYLSYLVMTVLVAAGIGLYLIPINYVFMALGIYKFTRKVLNPERVPNNDLLDFLSRVPDDKMLKQWHDHGVSSK